MICNRIHPLQKFLMKAKDVGSEPSLHNKLQRPLSVKSVNGTCSSRDGGEVDGVATLSLSSSSKAGPLSPSPSSWPSGEPAAAGGRQRSCRMTTDKVVTPLQPSQRDHLDSFNALSTKRILVDPKAVRRRQPSIDRNNMGEDTMSNKKCTGSGSGSGASFDSGSDSDSSEDLQYGPGFVSKLKSRYMSAAFKSSATSGLRRTASLEDFLDKDKEEVSIELNQPRMTKFQKKNNEDLRYIIIKLVKTFF